MAKPVPRTPNQIPQAVPAEAPPLNRTALFTSAGAYFLWLLFLIAVATGLIR